MNIETLEILSRVAYILAGVLFLTSIMMFFSFRIPKIFNELTGRAEKKFIEEAKKKNEAEEEKLQPALGTSGTLFSSDLLTSNSEKLMYKKTENLSLEQTTQLTAKPVIQDLSQKNSVSITDSEFYIIEEFSFTSSKEIIQ